MIRKWSEIRTKASAPMQHCPENIVSHMRFVGVLVSASFVTGVELILSDSAELGYRPKVPWNMSAQRVGGAS
jgi:hypothetical protein